MVENRPQQHEKIAVLDMPDFDKAVVLAGLNDIISKASFSESSDITLEQIAQLQRLERILTSPAFDNELEFPDVTSIADFEKLVKELGIDPKTEELLRKELKIESLDAKPLQESVTETNLPKSIERRIENVIAAKNPGIEKNHSSYQQKNLQEYRYQILEKVKNQLGERKIQNVRDLFLALKDLPSDEFNELIKNFDIAAIVGSEGAKIDMSKQELIEAFSTYKREGMLPKELIRTPETSIENQIRAQANNLRSVEEARIESMLSSKKAGKVLMEEALMETLEGDISEFDTDTIDSTIDAKFDPLLEELRERSGGKDNDQIRRLEIAKQTAKDVLAKKREEFVTLENKRAAIISEYRTSGESLQKTWIGKHKKLISTYRDQPQFAGATESEIAEIAYTQSELQKRLFREILENNIGPDGFDGQLQNLVLQAIDSGELILTDQSILKKFKKDGNIYGGQSPLIPIMVFVGSDHKLKDRILKGLYKEVDGIKALHISSRNQQTNEHTSFIVSGSMDEDVIMHEMVHHINAEAMVYAEELRLERATQISVDKVVRLFEKKFGIIEEASTREDLVKAIGISVAENITLEDAIKKSGIKIDNLYLENFKSWKHGQTHIDRIKSALESEIEGNLYEEPITKLIDQRTTKKIKIAETGLTTDTFDLSRSKHVTLAGVIELLNKTAGPNNDPNINRKNVRRELSNLIAKFQNELSDPSDIFKLIDELRSEVDPADKESVKGQLLEMLLKFDDAKIRSNLESITIKDSEDAVSCELGNFKFLPEDLAKSLSEYLFDNSQNTDKQELFAALITKFEEFQISLDNNEFIFAEGQEQYINILRSLGRGLKSAFGDFGSGEIDHNLISQNLKLFLEVFGRQIKPDDLIGQSDTVTKGGAKISASNDVAGSGFIRNFYDDHPYYSKIRETGVLDMIPGVGPIVRELGEIWNPWSLRYQLINKEIGPLGGIPFLKMAELQKAFPKLFLDKDNRFFEYDPTDYWKYIGLPIYELPFLKDKFKKREQIFPEAYIQPALSAYDEQAFSMIGMALAGAGVPKNQIYAIILNEVGGFNFESSGGKPERYTKDYGDDDEMRLNPMFIRLVNSLSDSDIAAKGLNPTEWRREMLRMSSSDQLVDRNGNILAQLDFNFTDADTGTRISTENLLKAVETIRSDDTIVDKDAEIKRRFGNKFKYLEKTVKGTITGGLLDEMLESVGGIALDSGYKIVEPNGTSRKATYEDTYAAIDNVGKIMMEMHHKSLGANLDGGGFGMENLVEQILEAEKQAKLLRNYWTNEESRNFIDNPTITLRAQDPNNPNDFIEETISLREAKVFVAHYQMARSKRIAKMGLWGIEYNNQLTRADEIEFARLESIGYEKLSNSDKLNYRNLLKRSQKGAQAAPFKKWSTDRDYVNGAKRKLTDNELNQGMMMAQDLSDAFMPLASKALDLVFGKVGTFNDLIAQGIDPGHITGEKDSNSAKNLRITRLFYEDSVHDLMEGLVYGIEEGKKLSLKWSHLRATANMYQSYTKEKKDYWEGINNLDDTVRVIILAICLTSILLPGSGIAALYSPQLLFGLIGSSIFVSPFINKWTKEWDKRNGAAKEALATLDGQFGQQFLGLYSDSFKSPNEINMAKLNYEAVKGVHKKMLTKFGQETSQDTNMVTRTVKNIFSRFM